MLVRLNWFHLTSLIALALLMWKRMSLFLRKNHQVLGLTFSSKLDWGSYIIPFAKSASIKIGALIFSVKFLSPEVAVYLYKSTIHLCMEYWCHIWAGTRSCYLELLDKLQKQICRTVGPSRAPYVGSLTKCSHFKFFSIGITLVNVHINWLNWFYFLLSREVYLLFW